MKAAIAAMSLAVACLFALPTIAQDKQSDAGHCMPHNALVDYLDRAFEEVRVASASLDEGQPAELFASRRGSWTLIEIRTDGLGCIKAYGERFQLQRAAS